MFIEQSYDEVYGSLKGGSENSGGKRLAISMVEEAWLSEKKEGRMHDVDMFGVDDLEGNEVIVDVREKIVEKEVSIANPITTAGEVVIAASVEDSAAPTTATTADINDELTLEKTLIAIKAAKPKVTKISQSSRPTNLVTDKTVYKEWEDKTKRAATTASSLEEEQDSGTACLPNDIIFEELARIWNVTPLFGTMMVNAQEEVGEDSGLHTDSHHTPTDTQPSSSKPQKKIKPKRKQRQATKVHSTSSEILVEESIPTPSNNPLPSREDSIQLNELMIFYTNSQQQVLDLEEAKTAQANKIVNLKKRVKKLEKMRKSRPAGLRRLKKGKSIEDIDQDAEIALVDEAQGRMHDADVFEVDNLEGNEVIVDVREKIVENEVSTDDPVTADELVTAASVEDSAAPTTTTTTDDKGKAKTIEPKKPLKKKDQIALDEEVARKLEAEIKAEIEEEERIARDKDKANRAVIVEWDDVQDTIDADRQLAKQIPAQEREKLSIKERSKLLAELIESRRKYFAAKRAEEIRNKPPTKVQQKILIECGGKPKETQAEVTKGSFKRAEQELEQESAKKQKLTELEQAKLVLLVYKVTVVFNKVSAAKIKRVTTARWIKTELA
nr:hypothetical protein [Tanacetum cinerariifolium]